MKKEVLWLNNPFDLSDVTRYPIADSMTIKQWLDSHGGIPRLNRMPTVCVYKGRELLRAEYDQPIEDYVCFVCKPCGGDSGSNPLAAVAMIGLAVAIPGLVGGMGAWALNAAGTGLSFAGAAVSAGIMIAGSALINAVFPPPGLPNTANPSTASSTYSVQAQGNAARLDSPIPVNYGRMRIYPDFAANPYTEFESDEQYLYQLFCIGQGENQVSEIRLENTPIENFAEVTYEIVPPLGKVTLFHTAVVTAPEAGGQDITDPIVLGPYIVNDVGTEVSRLAVDIIFPAGLIGVDEDDGDEYSVGVQLRIWADPINDDGNIIGTSIYIFNGTITDRTRTAIRRTLGRDVDPGRYQVTVQRITGTAPNNEVKNCQLGAVKGYLVDDNEYGDVTLLAMRVRATANLSDSASRLVNCLNERLIPVWDPNNGWSANNVITRNPAWAFADAVRSRYGGDYNDSEIDLTGLHYYAGLFDDRGDTFDGRFDTEQNLWDGLGKIGQVCRSGPVRQGNLIRMIRDQLIETPSQMFSMANMSEFNIDFIMHDDRTADSVKITYWDESRDYAETTILCQLPDDTTDNPEEVTLFGCTQYEQAWREGMYLAASNRERRQMVSWTTEMEGHIPTFGDLIWVNHDLLGAGQQFSGTVAGVEGDVLTLSQDVALEGESWFVVVRDRLGEPSDPLPCEQVSENSIRILDTMPDIETDPYKEPNHWMIGQGANVAFPVKVTAITPEADDKITIAGCIESEFVHTADEGEVPPPPPDVTPPPAGLDIEDLRATQGGTETHPVIFLSWTIAPGADSYLIEYSRDSGGEWQPAGTGQSLINSHEFECEPGLIVCRVAAVAAVRGGWAELEVNAGGEFDTPGQVVPRLAEPFEGNALNIKWDKEPAAARYLVEVWSQDIYRRGVYLDRYATTYAYHYTDAQQDAAGRTLTVKVRAQNAEGVNGEFGEVTATNEPPDVPDNVEVTGLMDSLIITCDPNTDEDIRELRVHGEQTSGFIPNASNLLGASTTSIFSVPVPVDTYWYVRLAWVDNWGVTDLNFSGEYEAEARLITETEIGPDSISTPLLKANAVVAEKIAADAITGEKISSSTTIIAGDTAGMNGAEYDENPAMNDIRFWAGVSEDEVIDAPFWVDTTGYLYASNAEIAGNMSASQIEGSSIIGSTLQGSTVTGGDITGVNITGSVIVGSTIILSEELYLCDPYGDGTIIYYDDYPDTPVACLPSLNEAESMDVDTNPGERTYLFNLVPAARTHGTIIISRARYAELPAGTINFVYDYSAAEEGEGNDRNLSVKVELIDPNTGEVHETSTVSNIVGSWIGLFTIGGIQFLVGPGNGGVTFFNTQQFYGEIGNPSKNGAVRVTLSKSTAVNPNGEDYRFTLALDNLVQP